MSKSTLGVCLLVLSVLLAVFLSGSKGNTPLWEFSLSGEVTSPPVITGDEVFAIVQQKVLVKIDSRGTVQKSVDLPAPNFFPLMELENALLLADNQGVLRAYAKNDLTVLWERPSGEPGIHSPIVFGGNRILGLSTKKNLFCLDGRTGEPLWEAGFEDEIVRMAAAQTLVCVHGKPSQEADRKLSGIDPATGKIAWTFSEPVTDQVPNDFQEYWFFCDRKGRPIALNQITGELCYRHAKEGLKIVGIFENSLVMLAAGGSRLECLHLKTGNLWSTTLPFPLEKCFGHNGFLFILDGKGARCVQSENGMIIWEKDMGKAFGGFAFESGLAITCRESYLARGTDFSCLDYRNGATLWLCRNQSAFWQPEAWKQGDLVVSRAGHVRLLPRPAENKVSESRHGESAVSAPEWRGRAEPVLPTASSTPIGASEAMFFQNFFSPEGVPGGKDPVPKNVTGH